MAFVMLLIGALFIVVAYNDTQGTLATALEQDVPPFMAWAIAIAAICAIGFVPGLKTPSRWLLGLVLVVLLLGNYQSLFPDIQNITKNAPQITGPESPTTALSQNPANPQITQAEVFGIANTSGGQQQPQGGTLQQIGLDPNAYLSPYAHQSGYDT